MDPRLPDRYALTEDPHLGEGGMGHVLRARDRVLDVPVALKLVRPDLAADGRFRRLFDAEVRLSARFHHPHLVPFHDVGETPDGTPFLGLALADAGSFANLRVSPPEWTELLRLVDELLDALAFLHARDVLHRDIKPENVLLHRGADGATHVWLADLGLAHAGSALARKKGRTEGTPGFMAPEQQLGNPREYGPWTDLYAVGVVLWTLVTGALPFGEDGTALGTELPAWSPRMAVPDGLAVVLRNVLSADPMARYDLAADLRAELAALGPPEPLPAPPPKGPATVAASLPSPYTGPAEYVEGGFGGVPWWNRPLPSALPDAPPSLPSGGALRASLAVLGLREVDLVAREPVRARLWAAAAGARRAGRPAVVIVVGEAGSGKTRLVEDLARNLEAGGWSQPIRMRWSRPSGPDDGYAGAATGLVRPWNETTEALRARLGRLLAREAGGRTADVDEELGLLVRWCGLGEGDDAVPAGLGLRTVYRRLEARSWRGLGVLVLDDVHAAVEEGDGLDIAESVLGTDESVRRPLLCLATVRTEALAADAALSARVAGLVDRGAQRIDLPRMDRGATRAVVDAVIQLDPALADRVADRCEGNPQLAISLLGDWAQRGWLVDAGGLRWTLAEGVDVDAAVPADAASILLGRVEQLLVGPEGGRRYRDAVHLAALAGPSMPRALLAALLGAENEDFMTGSGLWTVDESRARFVSPMLQEALRVAASARGDATYLHRRLARAWARTADPSDPPDLIVGRHAVLGRDPQFAVEALIRASERASRSGRVAELDEASRLLVAATESGAAVASRGVACQWRGRALLARGDAAAAEEAFRDALVAFDSARGAEWLDAGLGVAAAELARGALDDAGKRYDGVLGVARTLGLGRQEVAAINGKAALEAQKRNFAGAAILYLRAVNRADAVGDARGEAEGLLGAAGMARRQGAWKEALDQFREAAEALLRCGDPVAAARARVGAAETLRQREQFDEAASVLDAALAQTEEMGALAVAMEARLVLAAVHRVCRRGAEARRHYGRVVDWAERQGGFELGVVAHLGLAQLALAEGDVDAAYEPARIASVALKAVPGHALWAPYRLVVAEQLARRGDMERAWQWLYSASELGLGDTVDLDVALLLTGLWERATQAGWTTIARHAHRLAAAQWEALGDPLRIREITQN